MADKMTRQQRSKCMSHIRAKDTLPEVVIRRELFRQGYRFRKNVKTLPGTPDIVMPKYRTAVFINGCFWHGHKGCPHYTIPKTNDRFWRDKISGNQIRDQYNIQQLESLEWNVITIWECETKPALLPFTMDRLTEELAANKSKWGAYREKRKQDRTYSREQARKHREILRQLENEIDTQFHIPVKIRKESKEFDE